MLHKSGTEIKQQKPAKAHLIERRKPNGQCSTGFTYPAIGDWRRIGTNVIDADKVQLVQAEKDDSQKAH